MTELEHSDVEIPAGDGSMPAFLARPRSGGPYPTVLLLMEAFGLTPHIRDVAKRIAAEGYVTLAPDLYYRDLPNNKFGYDQVDQGIAMMLKLDLARFLDDARAALRFLNAQPGVQPHNTGVTGFCLGGGLTFLTACELSGAIAAAAPFYGMLRDEWIQAVDKITVPVYLFFGSADPFIPPSRIQQIKARFDELGKHYQIKIYPGADHGFFCHERASYNARAAEDSWGELRAFFRHHLQKPARRFAVKAEN